MGTPLKPLQLLVNSKTLSTTFGKLSPNKQSLLTSPLKCVSLDSNIAKSNCKLHFNEYDNENDGFKNSLLINTPNKNKLLKRGLEIKKSFNILGSGSFGTVVRGYQKGVSVAVKITKNCNENANEANVLNISHENIVKTIEIIKNPSSTFCLVIMEYSKNSVELQNVLDDINREINFKNIIKFAINICKGLQHCHQIGLLHLDLKPSNILVCEDGICKLCDFGNSCWIGNINENNYKHHGTVAYTAPEIFLGKIPTIKSDIYSLGIVLWQMLYRKSPYGNIDNNETLIYKVVKTELRPNINYKNISTDYQNLYVQCWNSNQDRRPNIEAVLEILQILIDDVVI